ncbi:MAG: hypothetical protein M3N43_02105, partial [Actinomycetota bacterium]|nr:hypothetical protein [Actinomycetota bacterium]
ALGRGAAIACVAGAFGFGVVVLGDLAHTDSGVVFFIGALAGAVVGLSPRSDPRFEALGALLVGLLVSVAGVGTGFGWLELSALAGSALAAVWVLAGEWRPKDPWRWFRWGGAVLFVLTLVLLPMILDGGTLGHDESAYGVKARQWLEGTPGSGWSPHRGTGMSAYGYLVLALGGQEAGLRLLGLVGALGLAAGSWALGRRMANPRVGAIASVAVVAGPAVLRRSTEYLSDVPTAALLVFCMVIIWSEFNDRQAPSYRLLWVLPLAWGAFYLRYQSALSLALIAMVVGWLWWPKVRRRPGPVVWVVVLGLLGLIPHFVQSIDLTGRPWGILLNTSSGAVRAYVGEGLLDYAGQIGWHIGGYVGPIALVAALVGLITTWRSPETRNRYLFLLVPALVQVLGLGLISHGEPRFILFPLALVVVAGVMAIDGWISERGSAWPHALAWAACVLLVGSLALSAADARESVDSRAANNEPVELAALDVMDRAGGEACGVLTSYTPQITFYSRCASEIFETGKGPEEHLEQLRGEDRFMVLIENGKRQPIGPELQGFVDLTSGSPAVVVGTKRDAVVYTFEG